MKKKRIFVVILGLFVTVGFYACGKLEEGRKTENLKDEKILNSEKSTEANIETSSSVDATTEIDENPGSNEQIEDRTKAVDISATRAKVAEELKVIEKQANVLEARLQNAMSQAELNQISSELYQLWDNELNAVWQTLKDVLEPNKMEVLTAKQKDWVTYKENEVKKAGLEYEGGSMQGMVESNRGAELTKEKVYELVEELK